MHAIIIIYLKYFVNQTEPGYGKHLVSNNNEKETP